MPGNDSEIPKFWFERLNARFKVPTWVGALLFGAGPFLVLGLPAVWLIGGSPEELLPLVGFGFAITFGVALFTFYTGGYLRREIANLLTYVQEIEESPVKERPKLDFSSLTSLRRIGLAYAFLLAFAVPLFTFSAPSQSLLDNLEGEIPYLWFNFVLASFIWTFAYSNYSVYRMGKLPLKLKPYTQDRTLGLKPFATASLNSTLIYFGVSTALVTAIVLGQQIPLLAALLFLWLYPLGLFLFLLPLRGLHRKLVEEKAKKLAWLEPRATALLNRLESDPGVRIDQDIANELTAIDKIQKDIRQIREWPFDTAIISRLAAVLLSATAILLSAYVRTILHV